MSHKVVKLRKPVKQGSEEIKELKIREPEANDLREMPVALTGKMKMGDFLDLAAVLADQPPSVINRLSASDALEVMQVVGNFIMPSPPTGGN